MSFPVITPKSTWVISISESTGQPLSRHAAILAIPVAMFLYAAQGLVRDFRAELSAEGEGEQVAQVMSAEGDVKRRPPTRFRWFQAGKETGLYRGDSLRTAEGAGTRISFLEGAEAGGELEVGESSLVVLERTPAGKLSIKLGGGQLRYKAKTGSKADVQIQVGDRKFSAAGADASFSRKQGITTVDVSGGSVAPVGIKDAKPITQTDRLRIDALGKSQLLAKPAVLVAPAPGTSLATAGAQSARVAFRWTPVRRAERVRLEVSPAPDFKVITQSAEVSGMSHTLALPAGQHYWRIRGVGAASQSVTETSSLLIARPEGVLPLTPGSGERIAAGAEAIDVLFGWKASHYYKKFRLQVSRDPAFTEKLVDQEVQGTRILVPLRGEGRLYWRVQGIPEPAQLAGVQPTASEAQEFTVTRPAAAPVAVAAAPTEKAPAPAAPQTPSPPVAAAGALKAKLSAPVADARIRVAPGSERAEVPVELRFETAPSWKQARVRVWKSGTQVANELVKLRAGRGLLRWKAQTPGRFEWDVVAPEPARAPASLTAQSRAFSIEREFTAIRTEDLVGSGDYQQNRIKPGGKFPLTWKPYPGARSYRVIISDTHSMTRKVSEHQSKTPSVEVDVMRALKGGFFYQVVAATESGFTVTSSIEQLVLRLPAPAPVVPADNTRVPASEVPRGGILITWKKTGDVEGYVLEFARDAEFKDVVISRPSTENFVLLKGLKPDRYWWRVSGKAKDVRSAYSRPQRLSIVK